MSDFQDASISPYSSRELDTGEIRVLHLLPDNFDETINVRLDTVTLSPTLEYEALSYVWGTTLSPTPALVDNVKMTITANLESALRHLRDTSTTRIIWIDALCINQKNVPERNNQVSIMGTIYSLAQRVVIWLGPEHEDDHISSIISRGDDVDEKDFQWIMALCKLARRPWFSRVWVAQEFALSHEEPAVYVGRRCIPWPTFKQRFIAAEMAQFQGDAPSEVGLAVDESSARIARVEDTRVEDTRVEDTRVEDTRVEDTRVEDTRVEDTRVEDTRVEDTRATLSGNRERESNENAKGGRAASKKAHFSYQLIRTATLEATNPRDKVYGLLGMSEFEEHRIQPDYSQSKETVFAEAAAVLLRENHVEFYMYFPLHRPHGSTTSTHHTALKPSWVPDLTFACASTNMPVGDIPLNDITRIRQGYHRPDTLIELPSATEPEPLLHQLCSTLPVSSPAIHISKDNRTLHTYGVPLGTISHVLCTTGQHLEWTSVTSSGPNLLREFYNTVLVQKNISVRDLLLAMLTPAMRREELYADLLVMCEALLAPVARTEATGFAEDFLEGVGQLVELSTAKRTVVVTDSGRIGLVYCAEHDGVSEGDEVVGLFGVGFSFVLRRNRGEGERYKMINPAYVVGHKWGHKEFGNVVWRVPGLSRDEEERIWQAEKMAGNEEEKVWTWEEARDWGMREYVIE